MSSSIDIKKYKLNNLKRGNVIGIIGKRGTGKSIVTKNICYHFREIPRFVLLSKTEKNNHFFSDFIAPKCIFENCDSQFLQKIFHQQDVMISKYGKDDPRSHMVLVFDDMLCDKKLWKLPEIAELFMNGRHKCITFIFTLQYSIGITPELRGNVDVVFIFQEDTDTNKKKIYENYVGSFGQFKIFKQVFDSITVDHYCLVVNKTSASKNVEDKVFRYKASIKLPSFRSGDELFWSDLIQSKRIKKNGITINLN